MSIIYESDYVSIETEVSEVPWLKIFTQTAYKEMSEVPKHIRNEIYDLLDMIEKEMIRYYAPKKINIASFGNYMPHVHWHIMARFEDDSYYPEPMWGTKQRDTKMTLPSFDIFIKLLVKKMMCKYP